MKRRNHLTEQRETIPMTGTPEVGGGFEIMCITAGVGNGWEFPAHVLREAVALFDGVQCFIDHTPLESPDGHSVRDLAGLITEPVWDEAEQGIRARLTPFGPGAEVLTATAKEVLALDGVESKVGFSADLGFECEGNQVTEILRIYSVDFVVDPARGGAVLRALNSVQRGSDRRYEGASLRRELCEHVLESSLSSSDLPAPAKELIRRQFSHRGFPLSELREAIRDTRDFCAELSQGRAVHGVSSHVSGMFNSSDQVTAAVHDLLGASRPPELRGLRTARLSGIRELYTMMTGDYDFHGDYYAERARLSTADLPGILKNALNKLIAMRWEELGASGYRWWEPIVKVEHFDNLQQVTGILVGEMNLLPVVNESAAYTALDVSDSSETSDWTKYGGYIPLTIEMFERDDTMRLRQYPNKLAESGLRRISSLVAGIFTANKGAGPEMSDGKQVFCAEHHNVGSSPLTSESWEEACSAIWEQDMLTAAGSTAPKLATDGRYCVVHRKNRLNAQRILYPALTYETGITSENLQRGLLGDVVTCPEFTSPTDWVCVADPMVAPAIFIGERFGLMPEIYIADNQLTGALFSHDEIRVKARHFLNVMVADHRPMFKSNTGAA